MERSISLLPSFSFRLTFSVLVGIGAGRAVVALVPPDADVSVSAVVPAPDSCADGAVVCAVPSVSAALPAD